MKKTPIFILKFTRERGIKDSGNGKRIFPEEKTGKKQGEQVLYTIYIRGNNPAPYNQTFKRQDF
jgi:hypothetical protein